MIIRGHVVVYLLIVNWNGVTANTMLPVTKTGQVPPSLATRQTIEDKELTLAFSHARKDAERKHEIECHLTASETLSPFVISATTRLQNPLGFSPEVAELDKYGKYFISATLYLQERLSLSKKEVLFGLKYLDLSRVKDSTVRSCNKTLQKKVICDAASKYRTADGSCNNLIHPIWGKANTCYGRLIPPRYDDGVSSPRSSSPSGPLPLARDISREVHETTNNRIEGNYTHMVMQYGQFLTHETSLLIMERTEDKSMLNCCPLGKNPHPECFGIKIPNNKSDYFHQQNQSCMNFVRSTTCGIGCSLGPNEQTNRVTSYIDGSTIYGNDVDTTNSLRTFQGGLLKVQNSSDGDFPPNSFSPKTDQCSRPKDNYNCYETGDFRANQHLSITALQVVFLRFHNSAARAIQAANPKASDEDVFQRSRRIVVAVMQQVAFQEYIPPVLGPAYMSFFELETGTSSVYSETEEVYIFSEYGSAANRFGHSMVPETFFLDLQSNQTANFNDSYFLPVQLSQGLLEAIILHTTLQAGKQFDPTLVDAVTREMYRRVPENDTFGLDLASIDIQRGRDHGTDGYTKYLQHCFNLKVTMFEELGKVMSENNWRKLQSVYKDVDAIDLFTGGMSETSLEGGIVGPTFGCIIGMQFRKFKFGDRFYYEHREQPGSFNEEQLLEIRKSTLAQIMCKNSRNLGKLRPNAFLLESETNAMKSCEEFEDFKYSLF